MMGLDAQRQQHQRKAEPEGDNCTKGLSYASMLNEHNELVIQSIADRIFTAINQHHVTAC